jgi:hypothetical protein
LLVESGDVSPADRARLGEAVDRNLAALNCEYEDKRQTGRLVAVRIVDVPVGSWGALVRDRQSRPSGSLEQYKHPCLAPDLKFKDRLFALTAQASRAA